MEETNEILFAKENNGAREILIESKKDFICSCASKAAGKYIDCHDDIYSVSLIAFNDAIDAFDKEKGYFYSFAAKVIHNRVIDYLKSENKYGNIVSLNICSNDNEENTFDIEDKKSKVSSDTALEIYSLKEELEKFDISFFDLPKASPKAKKTKEVCLKVISFILRNKDVLKSIYDKRCLPANEISIGVPVSKKILDKHRKYIIAGVLICSGNYNIMGEYFDIEKEVCGR